MHVFSNSLVVTASDDYFYSIQLYRRLDNLFKKEKARYLLSLQKYEYSKF